MFSKVKQFSNILLHYRRDEKEEETYKLIVITHIYVSKIKTNYSTRIIKIKLICLPASATNS